MCEIVCGRGHLVVKFDSVPFGGFYRGERWILLGHHLQVVNCSLACL